MRINTIELKNFRQYVDQKIEFTHIPGRKVTIIHGENHIGKTTLVKALIWCLYGDSSVYKEDPVLVNRELEGGSVQIGQFVKVSVSVDLEHNGYSYFIKTEQNYTYLRENEGNYFSPNSKDPIRNIVKMSAEGETIPVKSSDIEQEIESILPRNLRDYFFYDGENNKIDDVAGKSNLQEAVKNIMNLTIREKLVQFFSPSARGKLRDRFSKDLVSDDPVEAANLQEQIEKLQGKLEQEKINNLQLKKDAEKLRNLAAELETKIQASAEGEKLQTALTQERANLQNFRKERERLFDSLCKAFDSEGGQRPGIAKMFMAQAYKEAGLADAYANLKVAARAYRHLTGDSVDEIIKKGVCICGEPITEGSDHYLHLIEAKDYLFPRDYSGMLDSLRTWYGSVVDSSEDAIKNMQDLASRLKRVIEAIERSESNIKQYETSLQGFDGDVGAWRREASEYLQKAAANERGVQDSESRIIPTWEQNIEELQQRIDKLAKANDKNAKLRTYLNYVDAIYEIARKRLEEKKEGIAAALEKEVNKIYCEIIGSKATELKLDPLTYNVTPYQGGKKIRLSTGQLTIKNLAFVGGLIYLSQHKDSIGDGDGELDLPDEYPLVMDAPFSSLDSENIMRACDILPKYCSQLIITLLDKDYMLAQEALKPYLDKSYSLLTNSTNTNSHFEED